MEWKSYVEDHSELSNAIIGVRVSDNVLENGDWQEDIITIVAGVVVNQNTYLKGCYGAPNMVGWDTAQINTWLKEDWSGSHPENYNEFCYM